MLCNNRLPEANLPTDLETYVRTKDASSLHLFLVLLEEKDRDRHKAGFWVRINGPLKNWHFRVYE